MNITLTVDGLTPAECIHFEEFLKRTGLAEYRALAQDEAEAYVMRSAGDKIYAALARLEYP